MAILLSLAVCAKTSGDTITISEVENGRTVTLKHGQILIVRLSAQLGNGFGWQVATLQADKLKQLGEAQVEPADREKVGGSQPEVFRFAAIAAGSSVLELRYARPWGRNTPAAKTFRVNVMVK